MLPEKDLSTISLYPSRLSRLVFRVPDHEQIDLNLNELLSWNSFELVLPDLNRMGLPYDLDVQDVDQKPFTRIEMPWGISLTPVGLYGKAAIGADGRPVQRFLWQHSSEALVSGDWAELWTTVLQNSLRQDLPNQFEVLGVRGFQRESTAGNPDTGDLVVTYSDRPGEEPPDWLGFAGDSARTAALGNRDRIKIATSLSRRFPYTGKAGRPNLNTGSIKYVSKVHPEDKSIGACFADGRTIPVDQFRLSARGGWLELDSHWTPRPGCELTGWTHSASLGRDHHVKIVNAGFLFPFGVEAELVILSERAFVKDEEGHFVAVLIKQAFLQIPQPNRVEIEHSETIFHSLSITTKRTPPLDLPSTGNPATYQDYDFFTPTVDGKPFEFEHSGFDWAGDAHSSKTPLIFVSNGTRSANGLIWEPGYEPGFDWKETRNPSTTHSIPTTGEGLRVVDREWNANPYRFAQYGEALVTVAKPLANGDTSQRVEWVEWTRGSVWSIPRNEQVASRPFLPRTRTMKVKLQGMTQFSGENTFSLATYRDTRFTAYPLLDPEPNASPAIYNANGPSAANDDSSAYLFFLETRDLIHDSGSPVPDTNPEMTRKRIRAIYFGTSVTPNPIPDLLFASINNEVQFGRSASSDSTGGLSVPDTHTSMLTRRFGAVGDATFNVRRWNGYTDTLKMKLAAARRLDYAAFRLAFRTQLNVDPFEKSRTQSDIDALVKAANTLMGFAPAVTQLSIAATQSQLSLAALPGSMPGLKLGDMFGADAQLIPGLSFADLFKNILMRDSSTPGDVVTASAEPRADPLQWNFRITGIDWLLQLIGNGPGQVSFSDLISMVANQGQSLDTSTPLALGVEASLLWSNDAFHEETIGPVKFIPIPGKTRFELEAKAKMPLGVGGLPESLSDLKIEPGKAEITSSAALKDFTVSVFDAIEIEFSRVSFTVSADGRKDFSTKIRDVRLVGILEFVGQLSKILGKADSDSGMDFDISLTRVRISQTIKFPPKEGKPLYVGTAQIINLAFGWGVMIPLSGRDVLTVSFALSSREKPLTIFVPSWYGGKAHILMEVTTRGLRMIEVSMEYGALIPIIWEIATGEASVTAGVFYMMRRPNPAVENDRGEVIFKAFVKAAASLDIAGIIHCNGLYMIALTYDPINRFLIGEATESVSVKIGFFRIGYSFTATHREKVKEGGDRLADAADKSQSDSCPSTMPPGEPGDKRLFGPALEPTRRDAFERIINGYLL
jgi:hypothetical protein